MQSTKQENREVAEKKTSAKKNKALRSKKGKVIFTLIVVLIIAILACFTIYVNGYDKVYPNTFAGDIDVSGMTTAEALTALNSELSADKLNGKTMPLSCNTQKTELALGDLGISFDNVAYAEKLVASGKEGNILSDTVSFISRIFMQTNVPPVISYNKDAVLAAFDEVTNGFETEPVGHTFVIGENEVTIHGAVNGVKADRDAAIAQFEEQLGKMDIVGINLEPKNTMPEELDIDEFYKWLTSDAQNSYYEKVDGKVIVHESKPKCEVDKKAVEDAINSIPMSADNTVKIPAVITEAESTFEELTENLYKDELGSYSTNFGGSTAARANNVRLAASRINGIELMPDEEFSYDKTILPRTAANGYMAAGVYVGNRVESGMGGGICQPSSTLYAAALYANLEILERHNHSLAVSYLPLGMDATIAEGVLDMRFRNSTGYPIKIVATAEGGVVTFKILGYNPNNISVDIQRSASGGAYHVTRIVKENGVEVKREQMTSSRYGQKEEDPKPEEPKPEEPPTEGEAATPAEETAPQPETSAPVIEEPTPAPAPEPVPTPAPVPSPEPTPIPSPEPVEPTLLTE